MPSFFFLMIRRPPRSTPFPTRRSSDLPVGVPLARHDGLEAAPERLLHEVLPGLDRKSTRLNSSHSSISYAVFFFFNDTATTEIYTFPYTTLFRSPGRRPAGSS